MSLFDELNSAPIAATQAELEAELEDALEGVDEEDLLEEPVYDIDPNTEFGLQYMTEFVNLNLATNSKSIRQIISEQSEALGLPKDLSKLRVTEGGLRYLDDATLNNQPQLGTVYILSIGHDSKQAD